MTLSMMLMFLLSCSSPELVKKNKIQQRWLGWDVEKVSATVGCKPEINDAFIGCVKRFQGSKGFRQDGVVGKSTLFEIEMEWMPASEVKIHRMVRNVIVFETKGYEHLVTANLEFKMPRNKAYRKTLTGISAYGVQYNQDYGSLCKVVREFKKDDPKKFRQIFGSTNHIMLKKICRRGRSGRDWGLKRGIRVQPIKVWHNGKYVYRDTWERPWKQRFELAGKYWRFKRIARLMAYKIYLKPYEPFLRKNGYTSKKSIAIAFNLSVHKGPATMRSYFRHRCKTNTCERHRLKMISKKYYRAKVILKNDAIGWSAWN